ncbi:hypothetical protein WILDE_8 [Arthrobacter phage Wilde]|uniref:Uncharacterized protein n=1 Tax=Arthrobacter phage Wilde TaxID=1772323 RepID=A0A0U4K434_9CAUD|nr:hypothetical protein WILDE_8 [Arthrobacter phage Wilde]
MVERTIVEWPNAGYELMVELTRQKCAEEERKRKWLERFATLALYYHGTPQYRWALGAIDLDRVYWVNGKPTDEYDHGGLSIAQRAFFAKTRPKRPFDILEAMVSAKKAMRGL